MSATLLALGDSQSFRVDQPIMVVGRSPDCDVVIQSSKISRQHCCIAQVNDYLVVRDLGSTNGVKINGERLDESKLHEGDELSIGNLPYRVTWQVVGDVGDSGLTPPRKLRLDDEVTQITAHSDDIFRPKDQSMPQTLMGDDISRLRHNYPDEPTTHG